MRPDDRGRVEPLGHLARRDDHSRDRRARSRLAYVIGEETHTTIAASTVCANQKAERALSCCIANSSRLARRWDATWLPSATSIGRCRSRGMHRDTAARRRRICPWGSGDGRRRRARQSSASSAYRVGFGSGQRTSEGSRVLGSVMRSTKGSFSMVRMVMSSDHRGASRQQQHVAALLKPIVGIRIVFDRNARGRGLMLRSSRRTSS